jgi:uncharacterized protein YndB with AHSA1/START domain
VKLLIEQYLPAPPSAVWPFLVEPELMNRWSEARIELVATGDGEEASAIGTLRTVTIRAWRSQTQLLEVIEHSEPGRRLVYRVISGIPARYHRGEITLHPDGDGTQLRWDVRFRFPLPGMAKVASLVLQRQLNNSMKALAREVAGAPTTVLAPASPEVDDSAELPALFAAAEATLLEQRNLADRLSQDGDPKSWFVRVYEYVTEEQLKACRDGLFTHPGWVLRLIPRFHHYYLQSLQRFMGESAGECEQHWWSSFRAMDRASRWKRRSGLESIGYGIARGMQAHIEEDLPRTLAEIYVWHYRDQCRYARFRADYLIMGNIFRAAASKIMKELPPGAKPLPFRVYDRLMLQEVKDALMARLYYDIARERRKAFERGERLVNLMMGSSAGAQNAGADEPLLASSLKRSRKARGSASVGQSS